MDNIKECSDNTLTGYSANIYQEAESGIPVAKIQLISNTDVETYDYYLMTQSFSET